MERIHDGPGVTVDVRDGMIEVEITALTVRPDSDQGLYQIMRALEELERSLKDARETVRWRQVMARQRARYEAGA